MYNDVWILEEVSLFLCPKQTHLKTNFTMKKLASITLVAIFAIGFTSCKKDYTCTCTAAGQDNIVIPINNAKKDDATSICNAAQATYSPDYTCSL